MSDVKNTASRMPEWLVPDRTKSGAFQREPVNGAWNNTVPVSAIGNDRDQNSRTAKTAMADRWKEHIQQLLNGEMEK